MNKKRLRLALEIISGRTHMDLDTLEYLGYDRYKISYYGMPDIEDLKSKSIDIILEAFDELKPATTED